jgi:hypothetical protein
MHVHDSRMGADVRARSFHGIAELPGLVVARSALIF